MGMVARAESKEVSVMRIDPIGENVLFMSIILALCDLK